MTKVLLDRSRNFTRRAFLLIVAAWSTLASSATDDEAVWTHYLAWLNGRVLGDLLGLDSYRKILADQGLPKDEVERRIALIHERSLKRPEAMRLWFNSMYGPHGAVGPDWPTPFLMDVIKGVKPGIALDVCMGEGRNSIFLAGLGWQVTGFDVSDVAVANALTKAKKAGVEITAMRSGYQEFDFGHEKWDLRPGKGRPLSLDVRTDELSADPLGVLRIGSGLAAWCSSICARRAGMNSFVGSIPPSFPRASMADFNATLAIVGNPRAFSSNSPSSVLTSSPRLGITLRSSAISRFKMSRLASNSLFENAIRASVCFDKAEFDGVRAFALS